MAGEVSRQVVPRRYGADARIEKSNIFAVREVKELSAKWNNRSVFNILGLLREYDGKSKGIDAGAADDGELLRELLLKIFAS